MTEFYVIVNVQIIGDRIHPEFITARTNKEEAERVARLYRDNYGSNVEIWDYLFDEKGNLLVGNI